MLLILHPPSNLIKTSSAGSCVSSQVAENYVHLSNRKAIIIILKDMLQNVQKAMLI